MQRVSLQNVHIKDPLWIEAMTKNFTFLSEMDDERVLSGFRKTAGIPTEKEPYGFWENSLIAGHAVGHYFSALAMAICVLSGSDPASELLSDYKRKADTIVMGLRECQKSLGNGFLSAATIQDPDNVEIQFDALEGKEEAQTWVPWYAFHKVLQGLIDLWKYSHTEGAKEAAIDLADWVVARVGKWDDEMKRKVLSVEYGGMNDSLYQLWRLLKEEDPEKAASYKQAAQKFDEPELYKDLLGFRNRLRGVHANATIPKFLGYLQGYEDPSDEKVVLSQKFWDLVVSRHTYATGGIGDMEHFFEDGMLDASRTQCNAESCCCYNMMKLSQMLFEITGERKYLDYVEKALWNAKLGSVGPSGGYTYFNPMGTGYYRLYSPSEPSKNPFWCCVGTGLEDFAKIGDQIFYEENGVVMIAQWISSELVLGNGDQIKISVDYKSGKLSLSVTGNEDKKIRLRIPDWLINRDEIVSENEDYKCFSIRPNEIKTIDFTMKLQMLSLSDNSDVIGFSYGPFVLCVPLGNEKWGISTGAGIDVYAPAWKSVFGASVKSDITYGKTNKAILDREFLKLPKGETIESFRSDFETYIQKNEDLSFTLEGFSDFEGKSVKLDLVPYYGMGNERYGIYWYVE
ncbi:MAG: glycoside hydrolase family 127 protein [Clostridiales bacterium]|nr:glycoside hydrolase family 127 protein [Clostridiales bacterium]